MAAVQRFILTGPVLCVATAPDIQYTLVTVVLYHYPRNSKIPQTIRTDALSSGDAEVPAARGNQRARRSHTQCMPSRRKGALTEHGLIPTGQLVECICENQPQTCNRWHSTRPCYGVRKKKKHKTEELAMFVDLLLFGAKLRS